VGQFYKVYEIAPCFRNEDIDATHNPEFEQIEVYWAFADWKRIMKLTEEMIAYTIKHIFGDYKVEIGDKILDFKPPWERLPMEEAIKRETGIDVSKLSFEELKEIAKKDLGIEDEEKLSRKGKIIEELFEKYVQPKITDPTFITLFRRDVSPLAKPHRENPEYVERFAVELCDLIGMKRYGDPVVVHFGEDEHVEGFSLTQLIETSLVSGHFANASKNVYLDIFSCKVYDPFKAAEFATKYFKGDDFDINVLFRK